MDEQGTDYVYVWPWSSFLITIVIIMDAPWGTSNMNGQEFHDCYGWQVVYFIVMDGHGLLSSWMAKEYYHYHGWPKGISITLVGRRIRLSPCMAKG